MRRTRLRTKGKSETAKIKAEIQSLLRQIVMIRDGGCILRAKRKCGGEIGETVIQADHLITRANSATYGESRLVVCLCIRCHGWKHWHKEAYDFLVKSVLPKETVELWEKCQEESWIPQRTGIYDWQLVKLSLEKELEELLANKQT